MTDRKAELFETNGGQAVRLPADFRFVGDEVYIRRDPETGAVILSERPSSWDGLFALYGDGAVPDDFMSPADRPQPTTDREPFADWESDR